MTEITFQTIQTLHSLSAGRGSCPGPDRPAGSMWVFGAYDGAQAAFPQGIAPYGEVGTLLTNSDTAGVLWGDAGVYLRRRPDRFFSHYRVDTYSGSAYYGLAAFLDARGLTPKLIQVQGTTNAATTLTTLLAALLADSDLSPWLQGARILTASGLLEIETKIPAVMAIPPGMITGGNTLSSNGSMVSEATVCAWRPWGRLPSGLWTPLAPPVLTTAHNDVRRFDCSGMTAIYTQILYANGPALPVAGPRLIDGGYDQAREDAAAALLLAWGTYDATTPANTTLGELGSFPTDERGAWTTARLISALDASPTVAATWGSTSKSWASAGLSRAQVQCHILQGLTFANIEVWGLDANHAARLLAPSTALSQGQALGFDVQGCTRIAALVFGWTSTASDKLLALTFQPLA